MAQVSAAMIIAANWATRIVHIPFAVPDKTSTQLSACNRIDPELIRRPIRYPHK
jgi:hypothetical protein